MKEHDRLQLIDIPRINTFVRMSREEIRQTLLDNADDILSREDKRSYILFAYQHGLAHFDRHFDSSYREDPDRILQGLIDDLCFSGPQIRVGFWARDGYLDHPSSADVPTCHEILPPWDRYSEAWVYYREFRVLSADHIDIMIDSLTKNRDQMPTDEYVTELLPLKTLSSTLRNDPVLNAAYIYDTNYRY